MIYQPEMQQVRNAVQRYGSGGDKSLECIGWTVNKKALADFKVYRFYRSGICIPPAEAEAPALKSALKRLAEIEERKKFRIFDFSIRMSGEKTFLRYTIRMNCGIPIEQYRSNYSELLSLLPELSPSGCAAAITRCIEAAISSQRGSLIILGAEVEKNSRLAAAKSYYSLRKYESYYDPRFILPDTAVLEELLRNIFDICGIGQEEQHFMCKKLQKAAALGYYPFMMGLTEQDDSIQCKVYCLLRPYERYSASLPLHTAKLLKSVINAGESAEGDLVRELCEMERLGLYLKGFAVSASNLQKNDEEYKIYFMPKPQGAVGDRDIQSVL